MNPVHVDGVTRFGYRGEADGVRLATFMPRFAKDHRFHLSEDGSWQLDLDLPEGARIEYLLEIEHQGHRQVLPDPDNHQIAHNPFGRNSVATGPGYRAPLWKEAALPQGTVSEIRVASLEYGGRRHHHVYTPAGHTPDTALPLLVVHDGSDYLRYAGLGQCLEWLIAIGRVQPRRLLLLEPRARHDEYIASPRHATHVIDEVIPHVRRRMHVHGRPGLMGASLGAVAAWHIAHQAPESFDALLLQSGTFAFDPHPELSTEMQQSITAFVTKAEHHRPATRVAMSCGRYESLIDWNRRVAASLEAAGSTVEFVEAWAGHDWGAWADRLAPALSFLYEPFQS